MSLPWDPRFTERSPMFEPLRAVSARLNAAAWPGLAELNRLCAGAVRPVINSQGLPIRFVSQKPAVRSFEDRYEPRIYLRGEVQTRCASWHDLFNALVWLAFPRTKAALNARHYAGTGAESAKGRRSRGRDAATLFDESGVIVATSVPALGAALRAFRWKDLFWVWREQVGVAMKIYLFGHALYEKALNPFPGMTGMGLIMAVEECFFAESLDNQLLILDEWAAARVAGETVFRSPSDLQPVPVLGYPGWDEANSREDYYDDTGYFRPGRMRRSLV